MSEITAPLTMWASSRSARTASWIVLGAAVLFLLAWSAISVHWNFAADDAEPEILNQIWRLTQGESIYRGTGTPPFVFGAYPPLYYAVAALGVKWTGLSFIPAKLISLLSAAAIAAGIYYLAWQWTRSVSLARWSAALLFLVPAFLYNSVRCHPQMMAVALSLWSFIFFLQNKLWQTLLVSPLLAVAAIYTKQSQIALPIAMAGWLLFYKPRWLLPYVTAVGIAGLVPCLVLQKVTHGCFLLDIYELAKLDYNAMRIPRAIYSVLGPVLIFAAVVILIYWQRQRQRKWEPLDCYFIVTLILTLASLGRVGVDGQYVLELLVVTLLFVVRSMPLFASRSRDLLFVAQTLFLLFYTPCFVALKKAPGELESAGAAEEIYPLLRSHPGPILSRQNSFALFGSGAIYVELFHFMELGRIGRWDETPLLEAQKNQTFAWVITKSPVDRELRRGELERFTPELMAAIDRNYRLEKKIAPYYIYCPR